jgi:hypothetical protein
VDPVDRQSVKDFSDVPTMVNQTQFAAEITTEAISCAVRSHDPMAR